MSHFSLLPEAGPALRKSVHIQAAAIIASLLLFHLLFPVVNIGSLQLEFKPANQLFPIATFITVYLLALRRATKKASSYTLTITSEEISTAIDKTKMITILIGEVRHIIKRDDGSYVITGNDVLRNIDVPKGIERADELESLLAAVKPLTAQSARVIRHVYLICTVVFMGLMGALFAQDKILSTALGAAFTGTLIYCWASVQKEKQFDRRMRWLTTISLIPAVLVIIRVISLWLE